METVVELRPAQQPSYPVVFHYFWEDLNEEDIQSQPPVREKRERQSISLNQLIGSQTTKPTRSQLEVAPLSLSHFGLKSGSPEQQVS
jgi:hypothetical protein